MGEEGVNARAEALTRDGARDETTDAAPGAGAGAEALTPYQLQLQAWLAQIVLVAANTQHAARTAGLSEATTEELLRALLSCELLRVYQPAQPPGQMVAVPMPLGGMRRGGVH